MKLNIVPANTGVTWVMLGVKTFFKQPLALGGLFLLFLITVAMLGSIPFIGIALGLMVLPAATLGLMVATLEAVRGKFPMPSVLATAFRAGRERMQAMLLLGALYAVAFLAVIALTVLIDGGEFAKMRLMGEMPTEAVMAQDSFRWAAWIGTGLSVPMSMMFWHAPALVHWHNVPPVKALFFSLIACVRNFGAYFIYMLAWLGLMMIAGLMLASLLSVLGVGNAGILNLMVPFALCLTAMFFSSVYFTFRDSFIHTEPTQADADVVE
jgi:hypothetical protein